VSALRCLLVLVTCATLVTLAPLARAETVRTKDGQRLQGELVKEGADEVVLKTRYGVLVIPTAAIAAIEGRASAAAPAPPRATPAAPAVDPAKVRALRLKARRLGQTGKTEAALAAYVELLALDADDVLAHVEVCALRAQLGQGVEAVAALRRAILAGFTDLEGLRRDPRLARLEGEPAYEQLVAQRAGLLLIAGRKAGARALHSLRARGATADYREASSEALRLTYVHALDDAAFAATRTELEGFVALARRELFRAAPSDAAPLLVVLLADEDRAVLGEATSSFDPTTSALTCAPFPFGALARAPAAQRELARALHAVDQQARRVRHPAWLEEGLAELLGSVAVVTTGLAPRPTPPVALAPPDGAAPFAGLFALGRADLERGGRAPRVGARSLLHYLWTRDALARFYAELTGSDETRALEAVLGEPAATTEQGWRAWVAGQRAPAVPFTGLVTTRTDRGLRVTYVQPESGAARGHLREADVVIAVDGARVRSDEDLSDLLGARAVGDEVEVTVLRGEQTLRGRVALSARPPGPIGPLRDEAPYVGVAVEQAASGVTIRSVDEGSPAAAAGLQAGDLLVSLDGLELPTVRTWLRAVRQKEPGQRGALLVERAGERLSVDVEFAPLGD
jgi:hypothetical protein